MVEYEIGFVINCLLRLLPREIGAAVGATGGGLSDLIHSGGESGRIEMVAGLSSEAPAKLPLKAGGTRSSEVTGSCAATTPVAVPCLGAL